jgi:hypothetical protein
MQRNIDMAALLLPACGFASLRGNDAWKDLRIALSPADNEAFSRFRPEIMRLGWTRRLTICRIASGHQAENIPAQITILAGNALDAEDALERRGAYMWRA